MLKCCTLPLGSQMGILTSYKLRRGSPLKPGVRAMVMGIMDMNKEQPQSVNLCLRMYTIVVVRERDGLKGLGLKHLILSCGVYLHFCRRLSASTALYLWSHASWYVGAVYRGVGRMTYALCGVHYKSQEVQESAPIPDHHFRNRLYLLLPLLPLTPNSLCYSFSLR